MMGKTSLVLIAVVLVALATCTIPVISPAPVEAGVGLFAWPVYPKPGPVTQGYGEYSGWFGGYHTGMDIGLTYGTAVRATAQGSVRLAGYYGGWGNVIVCRHYSAWWAQRGVARYCYSLYAHLSAIYVSPGQHVELGQTIGVIGSTGNSTGPHLHFELKSQQGVDRYGLLGPGYTNINPSTSGYYSNPWDYCVKY